MQPGLAGLSYPNCRMGFHRRRRQPPAGRACHSLTRLHLLEACHVAQHAAGMALEKAKTNMIEKQYGQNINSDPDIKLGPFSHMPGVILIL